jgi:glycosyltransferase involved in cell wall biosynthesis
MKILQLAPPWFAVPPIGYGGIEVVVSALTEGLLDDGHQVLLVASGGSRTRAELLSPYSEPPSERLGEGLVELPHVLSGYLMRGGFDVVHDHTVLGAAIGALVEDVPVVHTVHGDWVPDLRRVYELIGDRVSLVAISRAHAARAGDLPVAGVIYNGISLDRYPFQAEPGGYLAFVGRAGPEKGATVAIEVARRLGRRLRMALKVNEPEEHRWWQQVLVPLMDNGDVTVLRDATQAQKTALLGGADAVLVPIEWEEPFGLVMVEANACGTPVIAFARGAAPEVVANGRSGLLVRPGDIDEFCAAVDKVRDLDRLACRQHVADNFSALRMVRAYERLYDRVRRHARRSAGTPV